MVDKRKFKDTQVSLLGLGTMRLPCKTPVKREANPLISYERAQALVDMAYENGVNYFVIKFLNQRIHYENRWEEKKEFNRYKRHAGYSLIRL